jgi:hypothetical protein
MNTRASYPNMLTGKGGTKRAPKGPKAPMLPMQPEAPMPMMPKKPKGATMGKRVKGGY